MFNPESEVEPEVSGIPTSPVGGIFNPESGVEPEVSGIPISVFGDTSGISILGLASGTFVVGKSTGNVREPGTSPSFACLS